MQALQEGSCIPQQLCQELMGILGRGAQGEVVGASASAFDEGTAPKEELKCPLASGKMIKRGSARISHCSPSPPDSGVQSSEVVSKAEE